MLTYVFQPFSGSKPNVRQPDCYSVLKIKSEPTVTGRTSGIAQSEWGRLLYVAATLSAGNIYFDEGTDSCTAMSRTDGTSNGAFVVRRRGIVDVIRSTTMKFKSQLRVDGKGETSIKYLMKVDRIGLRHPSHDALMA